MKKLKVKTIAEQYHVDQQLILDELAGQGIELDGDVVPADMVELVEGYFADLFGDDTPAVPAAAKVKATAAKPAKTAGREAKSGKEPKTIKEPVKGKKKSDAADAANAAPGGDRVAHVAAPIIVKNLAEAVGRKPNELISDLIKLGELAGINQAVSEANARKLCASYGYELEIGKAPEKPAAAPAPVKAAKPSAPVKLVERPPVVTFLGHVDHGKTSLQDAVRHTHIVEGEAGRITQHIGASTIKFNGKPITFIDTPGHEAFSSMRARGASSTDIAVLVVSAAEGFKPQTVEAMNHARSAKVPLIVAINKMDLPEADPDKVLLQMQQNSLFSEDWGGEVGTVRVSAKTGKGLNELLERILLEAEILELRANPKASAEGVVLEAQVEPGLGPTAHVLVQNGTLRVGDVAICGNSWGKIRSLVSDRGEKLKSAGPSTPVKVVGLNGAPEAGSRLEVADSEKQARQECDRRIAERRGAMSGVSSIVTAEDLFSKLNSSSRETLNIIIKADVRGTGEAIAQSLAKLPSEKVCAQVIANSVGAITENDIMMAAASQAIVVGFHVRVNPGVNDLAKRQNVEIRLYSIIYELLEDITDALAGKLEPEKREREIGKATILQIFELNKGPRICGCLVESGSVRVGAHARVYREGELIYNGEIASLRRFQDDVKEVKSGLECGIRLDNFNDFAPGDNVEVYEIELKKATL